MITSVYKNIEYLDSLYIERALPNKGKILVIEGEKIYSYTKIGYSKNSSKELIIPQSLKFNSKLRKKRFIKSGDLLAYKKDYYLFAPFDGYLEEKDGGKFLVKHPEDYWLLSGITGNVEKIVPSRSCLINTSGFKFKFFETSLPEAEGELRVLPNPSELIEIDFMEKYVKNGIGQVVYTGDYLRKTLLEKAIEMGCEGLICGSCDRDTLLYARKNNFFVGVLSGFGRIPVHSKTFELLKQFDNKYLIVRPFSNEMFISSENILKSKNALIKTPYIFLKKGMDVICLDYPYFGWEAEVLEIESNLVNVRIKRNKEELKVAAFDLIALV